MKKGRACIAVHPNLKLLLRDLAFGPSSCLELVPILGVKKRQVLKYLEYARNQHLVYICSWQKTGGRLCPIYGLNPTHRKPDVPPPPRQPYPNPADPEAVRRFRLQKRVARRKYLAKLRDQK